MPNATTHRECLWFLFLTGNILSLFNLCKLCRTVTLGYVKLSSGSPRGQLISKGDFGLPKNKLEKFNFCPSLLGKKFFVRFLEELKAPKDVSKLTNL